MFSSRIKYSEDFPFCFVSTILHFEFTSWRKLYIVECSVARQKLIQGSLMSFPSCFLIISFPHLTLMLRLGLLSVLGWLTCKSVFCSSSSLLILISYFVGKLIWQEEISPQVKLLLMWLFIRESTSKEETLSGLFWMLVLWLNCN